MFPWKRRRNGEAPRFFISPAFALLIGVFALFDTQKLLLPILFAALLHECGHAAALRLLGGGLERMTITLFGASMTIRHSERLSYGRELLCVLAGPGVNLICALALGRAAVWWDYERGYLIAGIHMCLALFNLFPVRPLDGGRILYLLLCCLWEPVTAERVMHVSDCILSGLSLMLLTLLQGAVGGIHLPLLLLSLWFLFCLCRETGLVKCRESM